MIDSYFNEINQIKYLCIYVYNINDNNLYMNMNMIIYIK
jgi:hypothetical protein